MTSEAAVCCDGTGRSSRFHQSFPIVMVGGVSSAKMFREKSKMWTLSAVLLAYEKGSFLMPQRNMMWWVGSSMMMRRAGLSCHGKDANALILYKLVGMPSS